MCFLARGFKYGLYNKSRKRSFFRTGDTGNEIADTRIIAIYTNNTGHYLTIKHHQKQELANKMLASSFFHPHRIRN